MSFEMRVAGVALWWDGRVLLQHRDDFPHIVYPGCFAFFGGHLEGDESPESGAVREIEEELGVRLGELRLVHYDEDDGRRRWIFAAELPAPPESLILREGQGMRLFGRADLDEPRLVPRHREILRSLLAPGP